MKKISLGLLLTICLVNPALAELNTSEAVDLYKSNKHFSSVVNVVDELKILDMYPDHTFRGDKSVDRKELAETILKLIKFIESEKKVSLKKSKTVTEIYPDLEKNNDLLKVCNELALDYSINLFATAEKSFLPKKSVTRQELVFLTNQILELYADVNKNPYEQKSSKKIDLKDGIEHLVKYEIITDKNKFKLNDEINRYELAEFVNKMTNYLKK